VGLIQSSIEEVGVPTISISLSKEITGKVRPPRALYFGSPFGHPISYPGEVSRQLYVLRLLLKYLKEIRVPGTIVDIDLTAVGNFATSSS
jgi:D-proline reductase (dithiol) PrdB